MKPAHVVIIAAGMLSGCNEHQVSIKSEAKETIRFDDVHSSAHGEEGWIATFVSRAGDFGGMDSDSRISFSDDGRVSMTEYGYAPVEYSGTYSIDEHGIITSKFEKYTGEWPKMMFRKVDGRILLFRSDDATGLEFGGRGGAVETAEMKPFWPFGLTELSWERLRPKAETSNGDNGVFPILPGLEPGEGETRASDASPERNKE
ncbi:MAG: hypothetical protein V4689_11555 [Verrucomicrobiota bacterium]